MTTQEQEELEFAREYAKEREELEFAREYAAEQAASKPKDYGLKDYAAALTTGAQSGILTGLGGLPVNTIQNVVDLAKGVAGTAASGVNNYDDYRNAGKTHLVPEWAELQDRRGIVGTSEWIADKMRNAGVGAMINNPVDTPGGRILHNIGSFAGMTMMAPAGGTLRNMAYSVPAGAITGAVGETTDNPAYAGLAAMLSGAVPAGVANTTRYLLRGKQENIPIVNQNIHDFEVVGATPSLGNAMHGTPRGRSWSGIENLVSGLPFGMERMLNFRDVHNDKLQNIAENAGGVGSNPATSGGHTQRSLARKVAGWDQKSLALNELRDEIISRLPDTRVDVNSTKSILQQMVNQTPKDPDISAYLKTPSAGKLLRAVSSSTDEIPPTILTKPSTIVDELNRPLAYYRTVTDPGRPERGLDINSLAKLQKSIGEDAFNSSTLTPGSETGQLRQLYNAIGSDMLPGLDKLDPMAAQLTRRSKAFNTARLGSNAKNNPILGRQEIIAPVMNKNLTPEDAYYKMEAMVATKNPNLTEFNAIKKSMSPEARAEFASTMVNRMGHANNSAQNMEGDVFSHDKFLSDYNKLTPDAKNALFSGFSGAIKLRNDAENVAKVATNYRDSSLVFANKAGTANRGGAMSIYDKLISGGLGLIGGLGTSLAGGDVPASLAAGVTSAGALPAALISASRSLTNPKISKFAATRYSPLVDTNQALRAAAIMNDSNYGGSHP